MVIKHTWTSDSTDTGYLWVNTRTASASTIDPNPGWTFRVNPVGYWGEYTHEGITRPEPFTVTEGPSTLTVPNLEIQPGGMFVAEEFEERIKGEMMQMVQEYVTGLMPMLIDILRNAPSMFGVEKKMTEGFFCFNCGAAIVRGTETEPCPFCGR
jgi:hypothetical protein